MLLRKRRPPKWRVSYKTPEKSLRSSADYRHIRNYYLSNVGGRFGYFYFFFRFGGGEKKEASEQAAGGGFLLKI